MEYGNCVKLMIKDLQADVKPKKGKLLMLTVSRSPTEALLKALMASVFMSLRKG